MNWKGFLSRILLVAVAFPLLGSFIILIPQYNHLIFNMTVTAVSIMGALEAEAFFRVRGVRSLRILVAILAGTFPAFAYLEGMGVFPSGLFPLWIALVLIVLLVQACLVQKTAALPLLLGSVAASFFCVLYPAFFMSYLVRLSALPNSTLNILFFLCITFGNDMAAYFAGSLWGESTRIGLPASPQKSVVGFAAGLLGALIVVGLFYLLAPRYPPFGLIPNLLVGLAMGVLTIAGDLIESGLKRSAGVKDSGIVVPGRGGMLDSVDSMLLSVPFFYYLLTIISR